MMRSSRAFASEELARLFSLVRMFENARINAFQAPCVEERGPVDEAAQGCERKVVEHAHTGKRGCGQIFRTPLDRCPPRASGFEGDDLLARRGVSLAERLVVGAMQGDELCLAIIAEEAGRDGHRAACVQYVDHWLTVVWCNLDSGMCSGRCCPAD